MFVESIEIIQEKVEKAYPGQVVTFALNIDSLKQ